jgi:hypothetical protein
MRPATAAAAAAGAAGGSKNQPLLLGAAGGEAGRRRHGPMYDATAAVERAVEGEGSSSENPELAGIPAERLVGQKGSMRSAAA